VLPHKPRGAREAAGQRPQRRPVSQRRLLPHNFPVVGPDCQGTSGSPCGRTADLLAGGHVMSVLAVS
jgi:hypothetical protein